VASKQVWTIFYVQYFIHNATKSITFLKRY
jgi:hypothetical protein